MLRNRAGLRETSIPEKAIVMFRAKKSLFNTNTLKPKWLRGIKQ